ncbi:hypothetical protein CYY_008803 [Polysphondylium violaceum]|uniref:Protein kinase domain-containing protein n=1 Tax=Polysphondylium violaceum TaxID=133409 RepID=A0A8J4PUM1_9MYCE|nr:hypothetical protein CYY_008803 [Polysphondylium violaceum]
MGQNLSLQQQFPYVIGNPITSYTNKSIWTLHSGTRKDDGSAVSVFSFDIKKNPTKLEVAKNGFKRAKTIRHPNFLTFLDGIELETNIYIVTEPISPLDDKITEIKGFEHAISWGIYQISKALSFLNNDCNLTHGNLNTSNIFVTKGGDWKLGGLDLVSDLRDSNNNILKNHNDLVPLKYKAPEITKGQWSQLNQSPAYAVDSWMLGCLIYESYNGPMSKSEDVRDLNSIPKILHPQYQKCFSTKPETRLNPTKFLETAPYFQNSFVEICVFLENITLKDTFEKETFFKKLDQQIDKIPISVCKFKILPHLLTAFDYGPVNLKILGTLLKISSHLSSDEYNSRVVPSVVKWFASDDRALRINLLENLEHYIQHLSEDVVNNQIFPNVVNGFNDNPLLKETTLKSMLLFAPKLTDKTMIQLLKYLAALQKDQLPGIRTNTTICLGRIAQHMAEPTRKRVLIPAFSTSLRDPFPMSQNAGIQAFMFTIQYYNAEEIATRVIPELSRCLLSTDKTTRQSAIQGCNLFLQKVEKLLESIPTIDSSNNSPPSQSPNHNSTSHMNGNTSGGNNQGQQTAGGGNESMLGWAYGMTKKLYNNESPQSSSPTNIGNSQKPPSSSSQSNQSNQSSQKSYNNNSSNNSSSNNSSSINQKPKASKVIHDGWEDDDESYNNNDDDQVDIADTKKPTAFSSSKSSSTSYSKKKQESYDDDEDEYEDYEENQKYKADLPKLGNTSKPISNSIQIKNVVASPPISQSPPATTKSTTGGGMKLVSKTTTKLSKFNFEDDGWGDEGDGWGDSDNSKKEKKTISNNNSNFTDGWD